MKGRPSRWKIACPDRQKKKTDDTSDYAIRYGRFQKVQKGKVGKRGRIGLKIHAGRVDEQGRLKRQPEGVKRLEGGAKERKLAR